MNCKKSAQNVPIAANLRSKIEQKFSGEGAMPPSQWGGGHPLPTPHLLGLPVCKSWIHHWLYS